MGRTARTWMAAGMAVSISLLILGCDQSGDPVASVKPTAKPAAVETKPPPAAPEATPVTTPAKAAAPEEAAVQKKTLPPATPQKTSSPATPQKTPPAAPANTAPPAQVQNASTANPPAKPATATLVSALDFEKTTHDFGTMSDTDTGKCTFPFVNTSGETLLIREVKTSCGCTAAKLDKMEYAPGEGAEIGITFDPKGEGRQSKTITVISNAASSPDRLVIKADVVAFVKMDPKYIRLGEIPLGVAHKETVTLTSTDPNMEIKDVKAHGQFLKATLLGQRPGIGNPIHEVEVEITADAPWGDYNGSIAITCVGTPNGATAPVEHVARMSLSASMFGELKANQTMFRLSVVKPGAAFQKVIRLTRVSDVPFQITASEITRSSSPDIKIDVKPLKDENGYRLVLSGTAPEKPGSLYGTVLLTTDVPNEETIEIRYSGVVRE